MILPLTPCGSTDNARIKIFLWTQLMVFVNTNQQMDITKKSPTDLMCYQNYTLKNNFCNCSWKAGEESHNATYTLNYSTYEGDADNSFDAGHQTYFITDSSEMHFKKPIYVWVVAYEEDGIYSSKNITVLLDKAVKMDPPDIKSLSMEKHGRSVTVHWTRFDRFSEFMKTTREIQYTDKGHLFTTIQCDTHETSNTTNCFLNKNDHTRIPICKESCKFSLDGDKEHYIQIRQKYEEGIWSEWSHSASIPADIYYDLQASYKKSKLESNGIQTLRLEWTLGRKNQGDINYDITLTMVPCPDVKLHTRTKDNWFDANISAASYNASIEAFNHVEKTPPWYLSIAEDITASHVFGSDSENVKLSEGQLKISWENKQKKPENYCIEWQDSGEKEIPFNNIIRNFNSNHVNISTESFNLTQCYRIRVHSFNNRQHSTVRTAYYFRPSKNIGPENLTAVTKTSQSVLLQWNVFDEMCQGLLKNWEIFITDHNTNISRRENSTVNQHLVENLPLGFSCTFDVRGVTIYGEYTGRSVTTFTAVLADKTSINKWIAVMGICFLIGTVIYMTRTRIRMSLLPVLPDPSKSNVITFVPNDSNYILCPKYLIDTSSEKRQTDSLKIESNVAIKDTKMILKEPEIKQVAITSGIIDNDILVVAEAETDLQFAYKKQVVATTPCTEKEALILEMRKLNDDELATEADLKENVTLLCVCEDTISV